MDVLRMGDADSYQWLYFGGCYSLCKVKQDYPSKTYFVSEAADITTA